MPRRLWTKEELVVTLALYFQLPFGRLNHTTKEVIDLAHLIGRTENSVALRLSNFAACDPYIINSGRHGMIGGMSICQPIWDEYALNREKLFLDAEYYLASFAEKKVEDHLGLTNKDFTGKDRLAVIKQRVNQDVFRTMILNNYGYRCAISGLNISTLLIASHIIPWSDNVAERLNPENGICLSPLYDKAFDSGLIGILPDYEIVLSKELLDHKNEDFFKRSFALINHTKIILPEEHKPNPLFLQYHLDRIFARHN
jgi:putative restriction endonuclease